jgi:hypothetical protein
MKTWRLITGVVLVLLVGVLIGSMGSRLYLRHKYYFSLERKERTIHLLNHLSRELDLSREQKAEVEKILQGMAEKLHAHYLQQRPEAERIVEDSFSVIRQGLTDEQKKKFDELQERYRRRRHIADR